VRFVYGGDTVTEVGLSPLDGSSGGSACLTPSGFTSAPIGMLCRIIYPGHQAGADDTTQLFYDASERLVRIVDPGAEVVSFEYDAAGRMTSVRDSLANDWLLADSSRVASAANAATSAYDSAGRATSVSLPAPNGVTAEQRPQTTFTYQSGKTFVDEAGATVPTAAPANGHGRTVTFDAAYRILTDTSATGLTSSVVWNAEDQQLSTTDPNGRMSTSIYNAQDRLIASYGPAPAACFGADRRPTSACAVTPHSATTYDTGLNSLAATYWNNRNFSGVPETYGLGIGNAAGEISKNWVATSPPGVAADEFSIRLTGLITFPTAATYTFKTYADDGTRLWIDDLLLVDEWEGGAAHWSDAGTFTAKAGQQARIRIDYFDATSEARLELHWAAGSGSLATVPGSALSPDYGLVATSTVNDSAAAPYAGAVKSLSTSTSYQYPWLGAATSATVDPTGLALTSSATYETPGSGYLRRLTSTMPSGTGSASRPRGLPEPRVPVAELVQRHHRCRGAHRSRLPRSGRVPLPEHRGLGRAPGAAGARRSRRT
jgi:YD repeat-containing protein